MANKALILGGVALIAVAGLAMAGQKSPAGELRVYECDVSKKRFTVRTTPTMTAAEFIAARRVANNAACPGENATLVPDISRSAPELSVQFLG